MWHYGIAQSQHYNNKNNNSYDDDNVMHVSVCFEFFGGFL